MLWETIAVSWRIHQSCVRQTKSEQRRGRGEGIRRERTMKTQNENEISASHIARRDSGLCHAHTDIMPWTHRYL